MTLTSCPDTDQLAAMLNETLPEHEQSAVQTHLDGCTACQQRVEELIGASGAGGLPLSVLGEQQQPASNAQKSGTSARATIGFDPGRVQPDAFDDRSLDFLSPTDDPRHLGKLGHYEILAVVGRGGLGIVLKGYDTRLKRVVAIKAPLPEFAANAAARKRFAREAEAAAAVSHDHVVTIHAVEPDKYPYLVMEYVDGVSLQDKLDASGPLELKEILRIGMQTARGLAAAHEQGLVHRDIKPANILLENGVQRVKITDFGLARAVDDLSITQTGAVAGTPQFMSPEQAHGALVDHRSDLFSLGCLLYAMCTARSPFRAETTMAVLKRVCEDDPKPIRKVNPAMPEWLAEIVGKLLEKKPEQRFQSAREVADLLSRHLAHLQQPEANPQPTRLRVNRHDRAGRTARRFSLVRNVLLLLAGLSAVCIVGWRFTPYAGRFRYGSETPPTVPSPPATAQPSPPGPSQPVEIVRSSRVLSSPVTHADADVFAVAFSKDGGRAITGEFGGRVEIWDLAKGTLGFALLGHTEAVHAIAISPDERLLATAGEDSIIRLWAMDTAEPVKEIPGHSGWVMALAFRNGGKELVSVGWDFKNFGDNTIRLWDVETGEERWRIVDNLQFPVDMALAPDDSWAAVSDASFRRVGLWDIQTRSPRHFFDGFAAPLSVALSHDGALVAAGYHAEKQVDGKWNDPDNAFVRVWHVQSGRLLHELRGHCGSVLSLQFSPDDHYILSMASDRHDGNGQFVESSDHTARIWGTATGEELVRFQIDSALVARWLPDGRSICTGVRIWDVPPEFSPQAD